MILRCTAKMLTLLDVRANALADEQRSDDDWYLNLLWIERRKCLLLTHAGTLFSVFVADVRKADAGDYVTPIELVARPVDSSKRGFPSTDWTSKRSADQRLRCDWNNGWS